MPRQPSSILALASLFIPLIRAHGWISSVTVNGNDYPGADPSWHLSGDQPPSVVWYSDNYGKQNPIFSSAAHTNDMACHINANPGGKSVPVRAGDTLVLNWETPEGGEWRDSHEGPIIDYLATCNGDCNSAKAAELEFFKIAESGMFVSPHQTDDARQATFGLWATSILRANANTWAVKIPAGLSGQYVLRSEVFALMGAGNEGHAQMFPQCVSLDIQNADGAPSVNPYAVGAQSALGRDLYSETDPGISISIHGVIDNYDIPGPALWQAAKAAEPANPLPSGLKGLPMPQAGRNEDTGADANRNGGGNKSKRAPLVSSPFGRRLRRRRAVVV